MQEDGWLRDVRRAQVLVRSFEHDVGNAEAKDFVGFFHHFTRLGVVLIEIFAHSRELGTLAGEHVCSFHNSLFLGFGFTYV